MNSSSSPPVLYIDDDDEADIHQQPGSSHQTNHSLSRTPSASEMNSARKKRRLSDTNHQGHPSVVNWPKRQRNHHHPQRPTQNFLDSEPMILLDPNEYIIEKPDTPTYQSFDWSIQMQQPPALIPTRIPANPIPTVLNGNSPVKRSNDKFPLPVRKTSVVPPSPARQTSTVFPLPFPTPTTSVNRSNTQRGRPAKTSRIPTVQPAQTPPSPPIFATKRPSIPSSTASSSSEIRRQSLNGTGIFSAFHDSKYYRCNICKFKSVTSSALLQHLFTHMFFCDRCSFFTYSSYNLSQHLFEKHQIHLIEETAEPINPKAFDLLYITRCQDGTFALCMDSSSKQPSTSEPNLIISSAIPKEQSLEENPVFILNNQRTIGRWKRKEKSPHTFILMKHGKYFSKKKPICLHSLSLEYQICREQTRRQLGQTSHRKQQRITSRRRLIDEVANRLKMIVNQIVLDEESKCSEHSTFICALPNHILQTIFPEENLDVLIKSLRLTNKYSQAIEQKQHSQAEKNEYTYVLSSPDINQNEQSILSSLHSSLTNGDSIYTQTKIDKLPANYDNTHRYLGTNSNSQTPITNSKKVNPRPITSKPTRLTVDKNNNSVTSSIPSVIVLD